ncbi:Cation-transporting P-type ATPase, C-terminal [Dillenia turbinata]|uniref:Cation-transporting P-type ATPase, C-terminal n=1 Tax=Dillenia turbinata TaxID=194707 RepID=A0AAN8ZBS6_9MAGN
MANEETLRTIDTHNPITQVELPSHFHETPSNLQLHSNVNNTNHQFDEDIHKLVATLRTDVDTGICGDHADLCRRREEFGSNTCLEDSTNYPPQDTEHGGFIQLVHDVVKDTNIILLFCCSILSFALSIKRNGLQEGLHDGAFLFLAILIIISFSFIKNLFNQMIQKSTRRSNDGVDVVRKGRLQKIASSEVVVGDIVVLKSGDYVPAEGFLLHGDSLNLDDDFSLPKIHVGVKVLQGGGKLLVTAVGKNTEISKMMKSMSLNHNEESKLEIVAEKLNSKVEKILLCITLIVLVVQVFRCFVFENGCDGNKDPDPKGVKNTVEELMHETAKLMKKQDRRLNGLVSVLCMLVFSIREGLPLGIFMSMLCAAKRLHSTGLAKVRTLSASAAIGFVSTVCVDGIKDLMFKNFEMADLWVGLDKISEEVNLREVVDVKIYDVLLEAIGMSVSSSKEDHALALWAQRILGLDTVKLRQNCTILYNERFDPQNNDLRGVCLMKCESDDGEIGASMHWRGTPEIILPMCSYYYDQQGAKKTLDRDARIEFKRIIDEAGESPKLIAFAHEQLVIQDEEHHQPTQKEHQSKSKKHGLTLIGIVNLKNPYLLELKEAIRACQKSGVRVMLVTNESIEMAKFMAENSGILRQEGDADKAVIEACDIQNMPNDDKIREINTIANTSPSDKLQIVQCLRQRGELVAVTGRSSRDSPSLKEADVGLLLGDSGSKIANENSDIIVLQTNFSSISSLILYGRCVHENIQKYIQLELTLKLSAFSITTISSLFFTQNPLPPFQLLFVILIMDTFGPVALAMTSPSSPSSSSTFPLLTTKSMWRNIIVQVIYQTLIFLTLRLKGFGFVSSLDPNLMIFNFFVLSQVSVLINAKEIMKKKKNVKMETWKGTEGWFFVLVGVLVFLLLEVIEIGTHVARKQNPVPTKWCVTVALAAMSLPIGYAAKCCSWFKCN